MVSIDNKTYCITCRHVLEDECDVIAETKNGSIRFNLKCVKEVKDKNYNSYDEVLILEPQFEINNPIDKDKLFSKNSFDFNAKSNKGKLCRCFGYGKEIGIETNNLEFIGTVGEGYYVLNDKEEILGNGFSGAPVMCDSVILGMHEKHENKKCYAIQASQILNKINEYEEIRSDKYNAK